MNAAPVPAPIGPQPMAQWTRGRIDAVVIGASAGGIEALAVLLRAVPATLPAAIIVVLHLPREPRSLLADIFAPKCALPVTEAQDKMPVEPGTVYFAPPDYHVLVGRGPELALSVDEPVHFSRPSIDVLFESAADVYGERLLGMVLTGGNRDGADGLAAVQQRGGLVAVQDPAAAQVALMPQAALHRCPNALVMSLPQLAGLLQALQPQALQPQTLQPQALQPQTHQPRRTR